MSKYIILILSVCIIFGILYINSKFSIASSIASSITSIPPTLLNNNNDTVIIDKNTFGLHSKKWKVTNPSFIKVGNDYIYSIRLIYEDYDNTGNESFLVLGKKVNNKIIWSKPIKTTNKNSYFNTFRGIEDIRLFSIDSSIYFLGTSLQEPGFEGIPQIVLGKLLLDKNMDKNMDIKIIHLKTPMNPPISEKNWLPLHLDDNYLKFIYRWEYEKVNDDELQWKLTPILGVSNLLSGKTKIRSKLHALKKIPYFRGSTIPVFTSQKRPVSILPDTNVTVSKKATNVEDRWVCLIHEITPSNDGSSRFYCQRWIEFEEIPIDTFPHFDLSVTFVSKPFTLTSMSSFTKKESGIEFPMSMYPNEKNEWIICFGKDDSFAYLNYKLM